MHLEDKGVEELPLRGGRRCEGGQQLLWAGGEIMANMLIHPTGLYSGVANSTW